MPTATEPELKLPPNHGSQIRETLDAGGAFLYALREISTQGLLEGYSSPHHAQLSELFRLYVPLPLVGEAVGRDARGSIQ